VVGEAVDSFRHCSQRILVIAPEGTRSRVDRYKTGFLHIARGAGVPVLLIGLDYAARRVRIGPVITVGEDIDAERERIEAHYARIPGKHRR
jgi:1-acyl-sn-glycerol-3-phosphate acyltransferase